MSGALVGTLLPLLAASLVLGLPRHYHHHHHDWDEKVYDQRQNGTGNLRVHIDGVVIVHAPADSLAALAAASDTSDFEHQLTELLSSIGEGSSTTRRPAEATVVSTTEASTSNSPEGDSSDKPQNTEEDSEKPQKDEVDSTNKPQDDEGDSSDKPQTDKEVSKEKPQKDKDVSDHKPQKDKGDHTEQPAKEKRQHHLLSSFLIPLLRRIQ